MLVSGGRIAGAGRRRTACGRGQAGTACIDLGRRLGAARLQRFPLPPARCRPRARLDRPVRREKPRRHRGPRCADFLRRPRRAQRPRGLRQPAGTRICLKVRTLCPDPAPTSTPLCPDNPLAPSRPGLRPATSWLCNTAALRAPPASRRPRRPRRAAASDLGPDGGAQRPAAGQCGQSGPPAAAGRDR